MSCFWRHQWGKWADKENLRAKSVKIPDDDGVLVIVQERRCGRCNAVQLRYVKARESL